MDGRESESYDLKQQNEEVTIMQKVLYTLALAASIAIVGMYADVSAEYVCGNVNNDGVVDVGDVVYMINYLFKVGPAPIPTNCVGDINNDNAVDVGDVVYLINYLFKGGPAPDPNCCSDCPPTVTDYDGNVYQTVLIGDQCWMMENLKVTHYRNGDPIPHVTDGVTWGNLTSGAYCNYNNDEGNVATYGRLYNWYAVDDSRNIAPAGWHVPSDAEWQTLVDYLGGDAVAGGKMKEAGTTHWASPNTGATNESGFTALPGGGPRPRWYLLHYGSQRLVLVFYGVQCWPRVVPVPELQLFAGFPLLQR